ncbi:GIY-YIG nuclease family protein [Pseudacidovorax sp. RU35E]|uniref:GIY-YIG nuclease family protein n=1 Tax=Pseudacidovorax sp. RU35E TaxID=1907403 RepID=UPI0009714C3F|nr:GIY-YIG nuclease family protein [Pseudacidovorax sp. RU35E]
MKPFSVYLLRCADGSYYAGHTDDLDARLQQHVAGRIGYTATRKPFTLSWQGEFETREAALAFELRIKGWSRAKKEALARGDWIAIQQVARSRTQGSADCGPCQTANPDPGPSPQSVRPELVEGQNSAQAEVVPRLRQAQPERTWGGHSRQAQPERIGGDQSGRAQPERTGDVDAATHPTNSSAETAP